MNHPNENNDDFSWSGLFIVTALCFFTFSYAMKFLNGSHSSLFNKIAIVCGALGLVALLAKFLPAGKNNNTQNSKMQ